MTREQIEEIGKDHYDDMVRLGWIDKELSNSHYLILIIGEVCEAIQADRKGNVTVSRNVSHSILQSEVDESPPTFSSRSPSSITARTRYKTNWPTPY